MMEYSRGIPIATPPNPTPNNDGQKPGRAQRLLRTFLVHAIDGLIFVPAIMISMDTMKQKATASSAACYAALVVNTVTQAFQEYSRLATRRAVDEALGVKPAVAGSSPLAAALLAAEGSLATSVVILVICTVPRETWDVRVKTAVGVALAGLAALGVLLAWSSGARKREGGGRRLWWAVMKPLVLGGVCMLVAYVLSLVAYKAVLARNSGVVTTQGAAPPPPDASQDATNP